MRLLHWSLRARHDLDRIQAWLGRVDGELAAAALVAIRSEAMRLPAFPDIGSPLPSGRRKWREGRYGYLIFYRVRADRIEILRIRHEREDWR